nr:PGF-pre-PGF domain-containing protein [Methanosarcina siciliae]
MKAIIQVALLFFDFTKNATCVMYVSFNSRKTAGKTTTIVEELKNESTFVSGLPPDEVYKFVNLWVGNSGYSTEKNIENPVIGFKVEKMANLLGEWIKSALAWKNDNGLKNG